jgi:hypothetical protein
MKALKKAILLPTRATAYRWKLLRLYYWADYELSAMRAVYVMPGWYYWCLYNVCLWIVRFGTFRRLADRAIHTIPYDVRFNMA